VVRAITGVDVECHMFARSTDVDIHATLRRLFNTVMSLAPGVTQAARPRLRRIAIRSARYSSPARLQDFALRGER